MGNQSSSVAVTLTTIGGDSLPTFHVQRDGAVFRIKATLKEQYGYPQDAQQLMLQGAVLKEEDELEALHELSLTLVLLPFDKASALRGAVVHGREAAVRNLLRRLPCDDEERSALLRGVQGGRTVLQLAASCGPSSVCEALLEATQSTEERVEMLAAKDRGGRTALLRAADCGHEDACRVLLAAAPSVEACERMLLAADRDDRTALHFSAIFGHGTVCQALLEAAPSQEVRRGMLTATDRFGMTATQVASDEACRLLLESAW